MHAHTQTSIDESTLVLGKLEFLNPGGSCKDRIAKSMLQVCVCVCVCVRERERERERVCV